MVFEVQSFWWTGNVNEGRSVQGVRLQDSQASVHRFSWISYSSGHRGLQGKEQGKQNTTRCLFPRATQELSKQEPRPGAIPVLQEVSSSVVAAGPTQPQLCSAGLPACSFQLRFLREAAPLNLSSKEHLEGSRVTVLCCSSENTGVLITESVSRGFSDRVSYKPLLGKSSLLLFLYKSPARAAIGSIPIRPCSAETADPWRT